MSAIMEELRLKSPFAGPPSLLVLSFKLLKDFLKFFAVSYQTVLVIVFKFIKGKA